MLKGKKILVGITGGIAAYKTPLLVRLLRKAGAEVKVVMTPAAKDFVTPLTLSTLTGHPVWSEFFNPADGSWHSHVELGLWADLFVVAPVTATTLGKMHHGIADNLLLATYLSARCPVMLAPAMDLDMFRHPSTQSNLKALEKFGNIIIEPGTGELASGLCGEGRMEEPENILARIQDHFEGQKMFAGKHVLITAGPTYEPIDPVRYIGNHSSGRMGIEIARVFAQRGAKVTLILGPTELTPNHPDIEVFPVSTAMEMYNACMALFPSSDIVVMSAAVADYRPANQASKKIKKEEEHLSLELVRNPDILQSVGQQKKAGQLLVGFALETDNAVENARKKLLHKNADLIVLNSLADEGAGFGHTTNKVSLISHEETEHLPLMSKAEVAVHLANKINRLLLHVQ
ncbi:MAG TPA: bifunctional phosphopantothenoylcysteine decarboxylase/phosphopantothenate--cysteine ligase CoaBC [Bacteroidales bacterium]|nr:bifunctional phosphopantothenoylcysteine decarboxylase/phosphopantothenate--cysteine ligase CoaBC [Bacteroidales bacterium]